MTLEAHPERSEAERDKLEVKRLTMHVLRLEAEVSARKATANHLFERLEKAEAELKVWKALRRKFMKAMFK